MVAPLGTWTLMMNLSGDVKKPARWRAETKKPARWLALGDWLRSAVHQDLTPLFWRCSAAGLTSPDDLRCTGEEIRCGLTQARTTRSGFASEVDEWSGIPDAAVLPGAVQVQIAVRSDREGAEHVGLQVGSHQRVFHVARQLIRREPRARP